MNITLLEQIVRARSVYPGEYEVGRILQTYLVGLGFRVTRQRVDAKRYNILAVRGSGTRAVLLYGHLDTVPVVDKIKWRTDPFVLTQKGDRLYGLGSYDMKGGIAAFLSAVEKTHGYVKIFLAVDEENISEGAWAAVHRDRKFFSDVALVISAEPNFGLGLHGITRGRTGRYLYRVDFEGAPAHVAKHKDGRDAIASLGTFVTDFYRQREKLFLSRGTFAQIRLVEGASVGMSVCAHTSLEVEVLPTHTDREKDIQRTLQSLTDARVGLKPRNTPYLPGYFFASFPHQAVIADVIHRHTGRPMTLHERMSVGDDNVLATIGVPVITWGPDGANAHAANEYVSRKSLEMLSAMYQEVLEKIAIEEQKRL